MEIYQNTATPVNATPFFPVVAQPEIAPVAVPQIKKSLGRPIAYRRELAAIGGGVTAGVFLSQMLYWTEVQDRDKPECDGWFYKSMQEWTEETGLTRTEQETVRRRLVKCGLMEEAVAGQPATVHFRANKEAILAALQALNLSKTKRRQRVSSCERLANRRAGNPQTNMPEIINQYVGFPQTLIETETTKEIPKRPQQQRARKIATPAPSPVPECVVVPSENETATASDNATAHKKGLSAQQQDLLTQMEAISVTPDVARVLLRDHDAALIETQLQVLDAREPRDAAATLVKSIRENWGLPPAYAAQQEAAQRATDERARRLQDETRQARAKAAERAKMAQGEAESAHLDAMWAVLDNETRHRIEALAEKNLGVVRGAGARRAERNRLMKELMGIDTPDRVH